MTKRTEKLMGFRELMKRQPLDLPKPLRPALVRARLPQLLGETLADKVTSIGLRDNLLVLHFEDDQWYAFFCKERRHLSAIIRQELPFVARIQCQLDERQ